MRFAIDSHEGQRRKGSDTPYIVHPLRVALTLERHGFGRPLVVAGLLHDVVEDCEVSLATISGTFGPEVAGLVDLVTERDKTLPWRERKQAALQHLDAFSREGAALKGADALDNLRSMLEDHVRVGDALWDRFNARAEDQAWYYGHVSRGVGSHLSDHPLATQLASAAADFERVVSATSRS